MQELVYDKSDRELEKKATSFADETIKEVAVKSKMLNSAVNSITSFSNMGNEASSNILSLDKKIRSLDPTGVDFSKAGFLFMFNPAQKYFNKVKQEESSITEIVSNLNSEKEILSRDNITLQIEIAKLNEIIEKLDEKCTAGEKLKTEVMAKVEQIKSQDEAKANFYIYNVLEPLEKRIYDLKEMKVVKQQSILALEVICRNNSEIIRNIEKVCSVTIEAFETAVVVAKSLYNQKITLNKIKEIEKSTGTIINITSKALLDDSMQIKQGTSNKLQNAFSKVINTIEEFESNNKKTFPENELQVLELKKMEGPYENN